MPAFEGNCDDCGEQVMMVKTRNGWFPYELYRYGVRHKCRSFYHDPAPSRPHILESDGVPKTRRTACWWCGESVFYHTNGNGDSVLLDELGPPWPVHPCWELYRSSRHQKVHPFLTGLAGEAAPTTQPQQEWPVGVEHLTVTDGNLDRLLVVVGYIFGWTTVPGVTQVPLRNTENAEDWTRLRVVGSDSVGYPVWLPSSRSTGYRINDLVRFECRLVPWGPKWYALALRSTVYRYPNGQAVSGRLARVGRKVRCRYCGDPLNREGSEWGLDESLRSECRRCFVFRAGRTPEEFVRLCRKIATHGRNSGDEAQADAVESEL